MNVKIFASKVRQLILQLQKLKQENVIIYLLVILQVLVILLMFKMLVEQ